MACMRLYRDKLYPSEDLKYFQENCKDFFYFMTERQNIWHNRFVEHLDRKLWTTNEVLSKTKYTNVYRQLDRGSLWSIQYIMGQIKPENYKTHREYFKTLLFNIMMYKTANRIETFEHTGIVLDVENFNIIRFYKRLMAFAKTSPITTSAHLTIPCRLGVSKAEGLCMSIADTLLNIDVMVEDCLNLFEEFKASPNSQNKEEWEDQRHAYAERFFKILLRGRAVGGFIAYEIYCDLCYSGAIPFTTNDFANIGPGAIEGIRMMYPSSKTYAEKFAKIKKLFHTSGQKFEKFGFDFKYYNRFEPVENALSLRTIEHSLCEYSKYFLQCRKVGKQRMLFNQTVTQHNCIVNPKTGDDMIPVNTKLYDKFFEKCHTVSEGNMNRAKLLDKINHSKDGVSDYIISLRDLIED